MPSLALTLSGVTEHVPLTGQEDAMRRYWQARQAGDLTAKLERVEDDPDPDPEPPTTPPGMVSDVAVERINRDEGWLAEAGFALAPPLYAPGTRVVPLGDDNFRLIRNNVEALPAFRDAADAVIAEIAKERRDDVHVSSDQLILHSDGTVELGGRLAVKLELHPFRQLMQLLGLGCGSRYLAEFCSAEMRAKNLAWQLAQRREPRDLVFRTRVADNGERTAFACVTPTYAAVDTDQVLEAVAPALEDAHVELRYEGSGMTATAYWMPDEIVDLAAGDVFKVGVRIECDDTGRGRIRVSGVVFRNLCLNLIIIGEGAVDTVNQVHRGDPSRILDTVTAGVEAARESVGNFLEAWGHARTIKVDAEATLRQLVEGRKLDLPGIRTAEQRDGIVSDLLAAWNHEPGDTAADVVNAMTRAAHSGRYDHLLQEALERQAAELVLLPA